MAVCLGLLPIAVYVISYLPWVALGNRITESWPPGNTGQTLLDLTRSMYEYHNNLRAAHAASSPWWAWPFDLKPVWFYQGGFAGNTAASIYDAGNLVIWWLGVPAMAFAAWQAWKRHSLGLGLIVIGFAFQYLTWVRIDRATFQYHYFTSLPFVVLGVAYFVAELWNGPSRATWLLARVAAAAAIVAPALLWVGKDPLCRFVRVEDVNPGSLACTGNPGDLVITARVAGLVLVMGVAVVALLYQLVQLQRVSRSAVNAGEGGAVLGIGGDERRHLLLLIATGVGAWIGIVLANSILDETVVYEARGFQSSYVALLVAIPLALIAAFVITARDARRFAMGIVFAALMAFLILYPNISALPLPSTIVNAYQGLLPTYLYPFQFPVNTDPAAPSSRAARARADPARRGPHGDVRRRGLRRVGLALRAGGAPPVRPPRAAVGAAWSPRGRSGDQGTPLDPGPAHAFGAAPRLATAAAAHRARGRVGGAPAPPRPPICRRAGVSPGATRDESVGKLRAGRHTQRVTHVSVGACFGRSARTRMSRAADRVALNAHGAADGWKGRTGSRSRLRCRRTSALAVIREDESRPQGASRRGEWWAGGVASGIARSRRQSGARGVPRRRRLASPLARVTVR